MRGSKDSVYSRPDLGALLHKFLHEPQRLERSLDWLQTEIRMIKLKHLYQFDEQFPNKVPVTFGHMSYHALKNKGYIKPLFDAESFKFAFKRNPFDRAISMFHYTKKIGKHDLSFTDFLLKVRGGVPAIGLYDVEGLSQANLQLCWISDPDGRIIADRLFPFENFAESVVALARELGIRPMFVKRNTSEARDSVAAVYQENRRAAELVRQIYEQDFERLDYSYDVAAAA